MKNENTTAETLQADLDTLVSRKAALHATLGTTAAKITEAQTLIDDGQLDSISELAIVNGQSQAITDALQVLAAKIDSKQSELQAATEEARREQLWARFSELRAQQNKVRAALNADIKCMDALYEKTLAAMTASQDAVNAATRAAGDALGISAQAFNIETARREASGQLGPLMQCDKSGPVGAELSATLFHNARQRAELQYRAQFELETHRAREATNRRELETQARVAAST